MPLNATAAAAVLKNATAAAATAAIAGSPDSPLRVVVANRPPLVILRNTSEGGTAYSGMLIEMLPRLLSAADIRRPYEIYPLAQGGGGSRLSNGSWTGIMGELVTGKADLALFPLTLTSARAQFIDASPPFMDAGYSLLTRIVRTDESYSFLLPFNWRTWLLLIASLFVVVIALSLLDWATRRARYRALERHYGLERAKVKRRREKAMQYTIESMMMLLGQGGAPRAHSWAVKIMFVCWAVFSVIMLAAYTANLTANLTVSQLSTTIKTLAELKQSGHLFGVPADSSVAKYFKDSSDSLASSLAPSMIEYRDPMQAIRDVRAGKIAAYATDYPVLKGYAADPPCDLFVSEDLFGPSQLVIGMTRLRGPGLAARIDAGLIELDETGVLSDLRRRWFVEMSTCASLAGNGADANASGGLTPGTLYGCFVLLAVGMVIAILWAAAEVGYYRLIFPRMQQLKLKHSDALSRTWTRFSLWKDDPDSPHEGGDAAGAMESGQAGAGSRKVSFDARSGAGGNSGRFTRGYESSSDGSRDGGGGGDGFGRRGRRPRKIDSMDEEHFMERVRSERGGAARACAVAAEVEAKAEAEEKAAAADAKEAAAKAAAAAEAKAAPVAGGRATPFAVSTPVPGGGMGRLDSLGWSEPGDSPPGANGATAVAAAAAAPAAATAAVAAAAPASPPEAAAARAAAPLTSQASLDRARPPPQQPQQQHPPPLPPPPPLPVLLQQRQQQRRRHSSGALTDSDVGGPPPQPQPQRQPSEQQWREVGTGVWAKAPAEAEAEVEGGAVAASATDEGAEIAPAAAASTAAPAPLPSKE